MDNDVLTIDDAVDADADATIDDAVDADADATIAVEGDADELLIEEISIDGMCGVY